MKAMILAAGRGTRVQPLTYEMPKPMIPILGKPVMEYLVEDLSRHGVTEIMVNVSHLPEQVERYFGDGRRWGVRIGYSFEGHIENGEIVAEPLGSAGGLRRIQDFSGFFDDTFVVVCGDALIDLDITTVVRRHWQKGAAASICVHEIPKQQVPNYGVVVCDEDSRILSFQEKPSIAEARSNLVNTGIYVFEPEILNLIPPGKNYDIGSELFPLIVREGLPFYAINESFNWIDIGRLSDYWEANQQLMLGKLRDVRVPGRQVQPGIWTGLNVAIDWADVEIEGPVYIGSSSRIESGVRIVGPTWIGHGCHVQSGAEINRSILFQYSRIGPKGCIKESVVCGRHCVDKEGNAIYDADSKLDWVGDARARDQDAAVFAVGRR